MDARECMIVDLEKPERRKFITRQVVSCAIESNGRIAVRFSSSPRTFRYNPERLLFLQNPEAVDISGKGLYIRNRKISKIAELLRFTTGRRTFYHVTYDNGYNEDFEGKDVYVTKTPINKTGGKLWDYLKHLAEETGLTTDDDESILSKQYDRIDLARDNVPLSQYLGDSTKLHRYSRPGYIIYPFGCNGSQKMAVERALTNQVSIIQGPPGTGKTQTILNILANLLMQGKTALIVSNNNSAVENVAEKLTKEGLGFIVAKLGSAENKHNFIDNQQQRPVIASWERADRASLCQYVENTLGILTNGFELQVKRSRLKAEYDSLLKEIKYEELSKNVTSSINWLASRKTKNILGLKNAYARRLESGNDISLAFRLRYALFYGLRFFSFLRKDAETVMDALDRSYYLSRKQELEENLTAVESQLSSMDIKLNLTRLRDSSMSLLKDRIARKFHSSRRQTFELKEIKSNSEEFLHEYPVVLSTTYSAKTNISQSMVFDYVIMDEASQVDIKTGALTLACANNIVIVGDDKQLPNVVSNEEALALNAIMAQYQIDKKYDALTHSFLSSCCEVFKDAPVTLLREHYRCHPKIIEFCNQQFYGGELVAMTEDKGEHDVLNIIRTVKGNHARSHFNQREIDTIEKEVIPSCLGSASVGIITPYRLQAQAINAKLGKDIASTVHKYQGRECDDIIMSMVDNEPTEFSDDANLINVAVSRAKNRLYVVTNGNEMPENSNIAQLIAYARFNNFDVKGSSLHSVFDLLYNQYTEERLAYEAKHPLKKNEYLTESLIYNLIKEAIRDLHSAHTGVVCHYPLSRLVGNWEVLSQDESQFAHSPMAHVDFMIYNSMTKQPLLAIEVDGWSYHIGENQQTRDNKKNSIFDKIGLTLHRISTTETVDAPYIRNLLTTVIHNKDICL